MNTQNVFLQLLRKCLYLGIAVAFSGLTFAPLAQADDTDVFLGGVTDTSVSSKPNVLFILDTSGSMLDPISSSNPSARMPVMQDALVRILSEVNDVNVGLMTFNYEGGPVRYPVRYIDEPVDPGPVIRPIQQSGDDAQQNLNAVNINSHLLHGYANVSAPVTVSISDNNHDGQEAHSNRAWTRNGASLDTQSADLGLLFHNTGIPAGATILSAELLLTIHTERTGPTNLTIQVEDLANATAFPTSGSPNNVLRDRIKLPLTQSWNNVPDEAASVTVVSPNFSALIQEVVNKPGWAPNNRIAVILQGGDGRRQFRSRDNSTSLQPKLRITYTTAAPATKLTGLRFQDVAIPQGATITRAQLDFTAAAASSTSMKYDIRGENAANAAAFTTAANNIGSRPRTTNSVGWTLTESWEANTRYQSPDIAPVIQEIVNRGDWCGGNALGLILESSDPDRLTYSYDGDPLKAPALYVEYDISDLAAPNTGCLLSEIAARVNAGYNDARQLSNNTVATGENPLEIGRNNQPVGVRFAVPVSRGTEIVSARVEFTASHADSNSIPAVTIRGHKVANSPVFVATNSNISNRLSQATGASVSWTPGNWAADVTYSADIKTIIQEIIDQPGWEFGNSLSLLLTGTGSGTNNRRRARSFENSAAQAPRLVLRVRQNLVDLPGGVVQTVRQQLIQEVRDIRTVLYTPIVNTYMEAIRYFRGMPMHWGKQRGVQNTTYDINSRLSHPDSYTGGTLNRPAGPPPCTNANLNSADCLKETITGSPVYTSPILDPCQANYIVLLSDGEQNQYKSADDIPALLNTAPDPSFPKTCTTANSGATCGLSLAEFARRFDQSTAHSGNQTIKTYTIGFAFSSDFLRDMAVRGGGSYHTADSADSLVHAFQSIVADILSKPTTFTAPTLTISAFNRLFNSDEVYISIFEPQRAARWAGNVKKYFLCKPDQAGCTVGQLMDASGVPAVANGYIKPTAQSAWGNLQDGPDVEVGGAGMQIRDQGHANRNLYTYTGGSLPVDVNLNVAAHRIPASPTNNAAITKAMLGDAGMSDAERSSLINWIRGQDVDDEDGNSITNETRWIFGDPLHSAATVVNYGKQGDTPISKLFVGANDGGLRMINTSNGREDWMFIPKELLSIQRILRANPSGNHVYGMDGSPVAWANDINGNGIIEKPLGDSVKVFIGQRRGGRNYYAFDVTPDSPLTSLTAVVHPRLLWQINGDLTPGFSRLGQTWSTPLRTRILMNESGNPVLRNVLIFGGGYDSVNDAVFGPAGAGNAIFIVDANTGGLIWSASSSDAIVTVPDMEYAIPSDIRLIDTNGDGATDRLYVGDLGGQVWRVDLTGALTAGSGANTVVGKLAALSDPDSEADQRRFMYRPQVALVNDIEFSDNPKYIALAINSGDRETPLGETVDDRVYVLRDYQMSYMSDTNGDRLADTFETITTDDLYNATSDITSTDSIEDLQESSGWYIDLLDSGEKGITEGAVLISSRPGEPPIYTFNTFAPGQQATAQSCSISVGTNRTYYINLLNANGTDIIDETTQARSKYNDAFGIAPSQAVGQLEGQDTVSVGMGSTYSEEPDNLDLGDNLLPIYITE